MTVYLDTSNLVKLYIKEDDSAQIRQLVESADVVVSSAIAYAEARATFARLQRMRQMTAEAMRRATDQLNADWARFVIVPANIDLIRGAGELAETHALSGCDAIHLASLETLLVRVDDDDVEFSCADERLVKAARSLGQFVT